MDEIIVCHHIRMNDFEEYFIGYCFLDEIPVDHSYES